MRVDYITTIVFGFQSLMVPDMSELDARLAGAFEGANGAEYSAAVASSIDPSNIFSTTSAVTFEAGLTVESNTGSNRIALIAAVSTMTLLALMAGIVVVKHIKYDEVTGKAIASDGITEKAIGSDDATDAESCSDNGATTRFPNDWHYLKRRCYNVVRLDTANE